MTIIELYRSILGSVNFVADDSALISYVIGNEKVPAQCSGKRMVLPTNEILLKPDWEHQIAFHPMAEAIIRGESPILRKLKVAVMSRITTVTTCLMSELMGIAVDHEYHKKLSPTQTEFLSLIPNVNAETLKKLENLLDVLSIDGERRMVSLFIKRGGTYKGKGYQRVAVVDFPLVAELKSEGTKAYGVNMASQKNKKAIMALFEYILPDADVPEAYSFGSGSLAAPNLHALLSAFVKVAKKLNKVTHLFRKHLDNPEELHISLDFADHIDDLAQFRDLIPSLQGNEGDVGDGSEPAQKPVAAPHVHQHPQVNTAKFAQAVVEREAEAKPLEPNLPWNGQSTFPPAAPAPAPAPAASSSGGGISWNKVVSSNPVLQQQQAMLQQQQQRFNPQPFAAPQPYQAPVQMSRGGYAQQQPQPFGFQQAATPFAQPNLFGAPPQQVMFPNGI